MSVTSCEGCGMCCIEQDTPPFSYVEGDRPPKELEWDVDLHAERYDYGLPCLWFNMETKRCNHYEHRPSACRTEVNPGDDVCLSFRKNLPVIDA